ncbi:hypothetical protein ACFX2F_025938 [Malus domestica]
MSKGPSRAYPSLAPKRQQSEVLAFDIDARTNEPFWFVFERFFPNTRVPRNRPNIYQSKAMLRNMILGNLTCLVCATLYDWGCRVEPENFFHCRLKVR